MRSSPQIPDKLHQIDAAADRLTIETVRGLEGFKLIRDSWESLVDRLQEHERFFHRPEWYQSYLDSPGRQSRLCEFYFSMAG